MRRNVFKTFTYMLVALTGVFSSKAFGLEIGRVLNDRISIPKPYLIINIPSTDCVMCRAGALSLLNAIEGKVDNHKIVILFDDAYLERQFDSNIHKDRSPLTLTDSLLSSQLSIGPRGSICLVKEDSVCLYLYDDMDRTNIEFICSQLQEKVDDNSSVKSRTSPQKAIQYDFSVLNNGILALFKKKYQAALIVNTNTRTERNVDVQMPGTVREIIYNEIKKLKNISLLPPEEALAILQRSAIPELLVLNISQNDMIFRINTVHETASSDTQQNVTVRGHYMIKASSAGTQQLFDFKSNDMYTLVDTVHYGGISYRPEPSYGFATYKDDAFLVFLRLDKEGNLEKPFQGFIGEIKLGRNSKAALISTFKIDTITTSANSLIKVSSGGKPVFIDNVLGRIYDFSITPLPYLFAAFRCRSADTLHWIYNWQVQNDKVVFVGKLGNKLFICKSKKKSRELICDPIEGSFDGFAIDQSTCIGYKSRDSGKLWCVTLQP